MKFTVYNMDVLEGLRRMKENGMQVDCITTSPPYWGLRDYGVEGQIGLEKHPQEYVDKMVEVFRASYSILKDTGSLWLNLGDSYFQTSPGGNGTEKAKVGNTKKGIQRRNHAEPDGSGWLQSKQLMLIPHRVAIGMQDDGWILRNTVIWYKPSHMPSSVRDRLTPSYEYVFHFVKQKDYYYDLDAIREPHSPITMDRMQKSLNGNYTNTNTKTPNLFNRMEGLNPLGKNPGDMWTVSMEPSKDAHFATFPTGLIRKPILATCPQWVCTRCGFIRERIVEKEKFEERSQDGRTKDQKSGVPMVPEKGWLTARNTVGYTDCECGTGWNPGVVFDPFLGSGTTLVEAQNQKKSGIGIELNPEYIPLILKRLNGDATQTSLSEKVVVYQANRGGLFE